MSIITPKTALMLVAFVWLSLVGCSSDVALEDGLYPVVGPDETLEAQVVELARVPLASAPNPENVHVMAQPLLRFRQVSNPDFTFDEGQCTRISIENSDELKAYTRTHVGSQVAMVIGGKVITAHKIREAIETDEISITFCIEGAGDHLHEHLKEIKFAAGT